MNIDKFLIYFTASFKPFPALNTATFFAAILMALPVWGFLPVRAFLFLTANVPNPTSVTESPFLSAFLIAASVASTAATASVLLHVTFATSSTNCALFINHLLFIILNKYGQLYILLQHKSIRIMLIMQIIFKMLYDC